MTVAVATPFNMDEQAFLQTMDRLIERFDDAVEAQQVQ